METKKNSSEISLVMSFYKPSTKSYFLFEKVIENILNQTYTDWEMLIIDDAGEDYQAIEFVRKIKDPRVTFEQFAVNSGKCPAKRYNYGLRKAKSKLVMQVFEDDCLHLDALKILKEALENNNADFSYARGIIHTQSGQLVFGAPGDVSKINKFNFIPNTLCLYKKDVINKVGEIDESLNANQDCDHEYWKRFYSTRLKGVFVDKVLAEIYGPIFLNNIRSGR